MNNPLLHASRHGELYKYLQNWGDNWNWENEHGETLVHYACLGDNPDALKFLIARGLDVNRESKRGIRPIHYACGRPEPRILEVLCMNGADLQAVDPRSKLTPYETLIEWTKELSSSIEQLRAYDCLIILRKFLPDPSVN